MAVVLTPKLIKIHILPDISRSKDLLMEYNMRNAFLENSCDNEEGGTSSHLQEIYVVFKVAKLNPKSGLCPCYSGVANIL